MKPFKVAAIGIGCLLVGLSSFIVGYRFDGPNGVRLTVHGGGNAVSIENDFFKVHVDEDGEVALLETQHGDMLGTKGKFYMSYFIDQGSAHYYTMARPEMRVCRHQPDLVDVMYRDASGPIIVELHYVVLNNCSGIYSYIIVEGKDTPAALMELRIAYRANPSIFTHAYTADELQGPMLTPEVLASATEIQDATYRLENGSVYTKYDWANYIDDDLVHGITGNNVGMWMIQASKEYVNGGPDKQELMVHQTHATPLLLSMLQGEHFGTLAQVFTHGDEKLYGPFLLYLNAGSDRNALIAGAKGRAMMERAAWPYTWMEDGRFVVQRGTVTGHVTTGVPSALGNITVILAKEPVNVYDQGKDYIFWAGTAANGSFSIPNVIPGTYCLFARGANRTDDLLVENVIVGNQAVTDIGEVSWPVNSSLEVAWQLGTADRRSRGFKYCDHPRQFGLWELVPANLSFTIGTSDESKDWYYAQSQPGHWKILFNTTESYTGGDTGILTIAMAGAAREPELNVHLDSSFLGSMAPGNDASIYRSAIQGGYYQLHEMHFPASLLDPGQHAIDLHLVDVGEKGGILYDAIKLEIASP
ncbi:hypothetical protein GF325_14050 [Candidatus Bathyarchaeota archaeon]|nr:hypothetical protein [Candidatus Bathyarchaeota archaeon]